MRRLARSFDSEARTHLADRADAALRRDRYADRLAEGDEKIVVFQPVLRRQSASQRHFRLVRILGAHVTPSVRDAMNMRIDADARLLEALCQHEVCGLAADTFQLQQLVDVVGDGARVLSQKSIANRVDRRSL